jgi:flagellar basal body P-ring formation protein FlgA
VTFARDSTAFDGEIVGRKARQAIAAQDILYAGMLEKEKALKRGDPVKVALGEGEWEVILMGVAEQDGFIGDTVKVRNPRSQQVIVATVTARGEVRAQ